MLNIASKIGLECWQIFTEAAPYILFGFFAAGILKALLPDQLIAKHLGGDNARSVFKAALFGIPLPLCSCGVIPAAISLRQQGASKGATASFLVSVPETGVDSVAITWALLDPLMTLIRPVTAFFTAVTAGLLINRLPEHRTRGEEPVAKCCGSGKLPSIPSAAPSQGEFGARIVGGLSYAFGSLLKDIGQWLLLGILIAGAISAFVPDDFIGNYLGNEFNSLLIMLVVGIPLYICASASTPIAAALVLKGLSPGAALVFLLAGPATNAATLTVIVRHLGKAATAVYLLAIAICSVGMGWLTNRLYSWLAIDIRSWVGTGEPSALSNLDFLAAMLLIGLLLRNYLPRRKSEADPCSCQAEAKGG